MLRILRYSYIMQTLCVTSCECFIFMWILFSLKEALLYGSFVYRVTSCHELEFLVSHQVRIKHNETLFTESIALNFTAAPITALNILYDYDI